VTRSFTPPDLPGRCHRCWVVQAHCICSELRPAANRTEIVFVRHYLEAYKSTGTARIATLVLERSRVVELRFEAAPCDAELAALGDAWLLYPGGGDVQAGDRPERLMVIDGTWAQSRRMLRKLPALHGLRRLSLPAPPIEVGKVLRKSPHASGYSTIRAVAAALEALEGPEVAAPLEQAARLHTHRVLLARHGPAGHLPTQ
jgi:DTW domain-containing protein